MAHPTWEQIGSLQYTRWVIQETLRLYPPTTSNARIANKDTTLPNGGGADGSSPIFVPKGGIVHFSTWARHRQGTDFGEDPESFYPGRWQHLSPDVPGFLPFNKGPRICPGQHVAMAVITYIVARTFQTFATMTNYNTKPWVERIHMALENENGVLIGLS
ncbi:cytochrome P450 [Aspergillus californicus]